MKKLRTIIIDDEAHVRDLIRNIIEQYCESSEVVATADGVTSGLLAIRQYHPDLVLLDIKIADGTAFDLLQQLGDIDFSIIFITAYDNYAVNAFRFSAVDYIMKPINIDELINAIKKASERTEFQSLSLKLKTIFENLNSKPEGKKIVLKTQESIHIVKVCDIIRCESDHNYTTFYFNNGKKVLVSKTLKEFEDILIDYGFFRTHQSHLININYISSFEKNDGGYIMMTDKSQIPVSKRKREELLGIFSQF